MNSVDSLSFLKKNDAFNRQTILIDIGTSYTRCGINGSLNPLSVFQYDFSEYMKSEIPLNKEQWMDVLSNYFSLIFSKYIITSVVDKNIIIGHNIYASTFFLDALCDIMLNSCKVAGLYLFPSLCTIPLSQTFLTGIAVNCGYIESSSITMIKGMPLQYTLKSLPIGYNTIQTAIKNVEGFKKLSDPLVEQIIKEAVYVHNNDSKLAEDYSIYDSNYHSIILPADIRASVCECLYDENHDCCSLCSIICDTLIASPSIYRQQLVSHIYLSGSLPTLPGFTKRLYTELYKFINTHEEYSILKPLLKSIHITSENSFLSSFMGLSVLSSLNISIPYITLESYSQHGYIDPLIEGNLSFE